MLRTRQVTLRHLDLVRLTLGTSERLARRRESEHVGGRERIRAASKSSNAARVPAATCSRRAGLFDRHDAQLDALCAAQHNQRQRDADPLVDQPAVQVVNSGHGVAADVDDDVPLA